MPASSRAIVCLGATDDDRIVRSITNWCVRAVPDERSVYEASRSCKAGNLHHRMPATMHTCQIGTLTLLTVALAGAAGCSGDATSPSGDSTQNASVYVDSPVAQREFTGG